MVSLDQRSPLAPDTTPLRLGDVDLPDLRRADQLGGLVYEYGMVA
ncbi:MAG TPA: hypothetical protein VK425_05540 [Acidimicrobiales bacterium]|nr:hypothetical protein [Acidimicrobiales bacterium]